MGLYYILPTLLTSTYLAAILRQRLLLQQQQLAPQTQQRVELCITSEDTSLFQNQCVDCSYSLFSQTVMTCTGASSLPANITYEQASCLVEQCTAQIPFQRYPTIRPDAGGGGGGGTNGDGRANPTRQKVRLHRKAKITKVKKAKVPPKGGGRGRTQKPKNNNKPKTTARPRNGKQASKTTTKKPKTPNRNIQRKNNTVLVRGKDGNYYYKTRSKRDVVQPIRIVKMTVYTSVVMNDLIEEDQMKFMKEEDL